MCGRFTDHVVWGAARVGQCPLVGTTRKENHAAFLVWMVRFVAFPPGIVKVFGATRAYPMFINLYIHMLVFVHLVSGVCVSLMTCVTFGALYLCSIPHFFGWAVLLCYFFVGVKRGSPPAFVWAIIFILFILDSTFAVNQYLQQKEIGKWCVYHFSHLLQIKRQCFFPCCVLVRARDFSIQPKHYFLDWFHICCDDLHVCHCVGFTTCCPHRIAGKTMFTANMCFAFCPCLPNNCWPGSILGGRPL